MEYLDKVKAQLKKNVIRRKGRMDINAGKIDLQLQAK